LLANSLPGFGLTEILGTHPGRILAGKVGGPWQGRPGGSLARPMLLCGMAALRHLRAPFYRLTYRPAQRARMARACMTIEKCVNEYDVGHVIFEEGSTGRELYVVLDGEVEIAKINGASKTVIVTLGKGEFFGEMAVIDGSSRSATAIAAAPHTRVMRINHARFVYLVSQQPAFALMIMDALSKRLRASNERTFRPAANS
jgi:CRP/FNR family cyclic AMP-dependent transcriptional regulator